MREKKKLINFRRASFKGVINLNRKKRSHEAIEHWFTCKIIFCNSLPLNCINYTGTHRQTRLLAILCSVSLLESYSLARQPHCSTSIYAVRPWPWPASQLRTEKSGRDLVSHTLFLICSWPFRAAGNQHQQDRGLGAMSKHTGTEAVEVGPGNQSTWSSASKKRRTAEWNKKERANDRKENWKAPEPYLNHLTLDRASPTNPNPICKHQNPKSNLMF